VQRALLLASPVLFLTCTPTDITGTTGATKAAGVSQEWDLVNDAGQLVTVSVPAGTFGTVFNEIRGGWNVLIPGCNAIHLTVGGNISGTNWDFVGLTGSGCNVNISGRGTGTTSVAFNKTSVGAVVNGSLSLNFQGAVNQTIAGNWQGVRTK